MKPSLWRISYKERVETKSKKIREVKPEEFEKDTKKWNFSDEGGNLREKLNQGNQDKKDSN